MAACNLDPSGTRIEPRGSHAAGPMGAARLFALALRDNTVLDRTVCVKCELYGSVPTTGHRHDRGREVLLGLEGEEADRLDPAAIAPRLRRIHDKRELRLLGTRRIAFDKRHHLAFARRDSSTSPADGMRLSAFDPAGWLLLEKTFTWSAGREEDSGQRHVEGGAAVGSCRTPA